MLNHYGKDKFALTLNDEETVKTAVISPKVHTEWITFRTLLAKKPEDSIALQLKRAHHKCNASYNVPKLTKDSLNCLTLPVSTASVERSFSQMKLIKTRLRNTLSEGRLNQLMRIAMEYPDQLTEGEIEVILDLEQETSMKIYLNPVNNYRNNYSSLCCNS